MIKDVVITAGYAQSLHSLALAHGLSINEVNVKAIIIVKTFQLKRIRFYLKQYGWKTVREKFFSLVLRMPDSNLSGESKFVKKYLSEKNCEVENLLAFAKKNKVPVKFVQSLNSEDSITFIKKINPEAIIYAGGGILKKRFLSIAKRGVLNAHSGLLPFFRGMNVIEWSILYGIEPYTTVHFIESGIDTGDIIYKRKLPVQGLKTLAEYRGMGTRNEVEALVQVAVNFDHYRKSLIKQKKEEGRQFFVMHPYLRKRVNKIIEHDLPLMDDIRKRRFDNLDQE
jgi:folate-dependent phosphoribosylglycinamide formyltransferase PurN